MLAAPDADAAEEDANPVPFWQLPMSFQVGVVGTLNNQQGEGLHEPIVNRSARLTGYLGQFEEAGAENLNLMRHDEQQRYESQHNMASSQFMSARERSVENYNDHKEKHGRKRKKIMLSGLDVESYHNNNLNRKPAKYDHVTVRRAVTRVSQGETITAVAADIGCCRQTVTNFFAYKEREGLLRDHAAGPFDNSTIPDLVPTNVQQKARAHWLIHAEEDVIMEMIDVIIIMYALDPKTTYLEIATAVQLLFPNDFPDVNKQQIGRFIRDNLKWTGKKVETQWARGNINENIAGRVAYIRRMLGEDRPGPGEQGPDPGVGLLEWLAQGHDMGEVISVDEAGTNARTRSSGGSGSRTMAPRGMSFVTTELPKSANVTMLSAVGRSSIKKLTQFAGAVNQHRFATFMTELCAGLHAEDPNKRFLIQIDNARSHTAVYITMILAGLQAQYPNIKFIFLPRYSPWLNTIEFVWHHVRKLIARQQKEGGGPKAHHASLTAFVIDGNAQAMMNLHANGAHIIEACWTHSVKWWPSTLQGEAFMSFDRRTTKHDYFYEASAALDVVTRARDMVRSLLTAVMLSDELRADFVQRAEALVVELLAVGPELQHFVARVQLLANGLAP
jgi:hypothetical protein